jgi:ferrous iron transport protein B
MGVLFGAGEEVARLDAVLGGTLTPAAALAFLVVQMLFVPCVAVVATIKQETQSWRWTAFSVGLLLLLSVMGGIATYHVVGLLNLTS